MLASYFGFAQNPITTHPTDERGCTRGGFVATFTINSVSGAVYQWEADTGTGFSVVPAVSPFGGVNGPVLTISNPDGCKGGFTKDSTLFRCRIFLGGVGGTYVSNSARLILYAPIDSSDFVTKYGTFVSNVPNDTVCEGGSTSFGVTNLATIDTCVGIKDQSYQWQYQVFGSSSWINVPGTNPTAQLATLSITNIPLSWDMRKYRCRMQTSGCTQFFYSDTVRLIVDPKPYAEFDTTNIYVCEGDSFTVNINVSNSALHPNRGSLPTGWELYFDTSLMGGYAYLFANAPLDSVTGVGNGTPALSIGHSGISTTGVYTLKLDSIVNDSSSLRCPRALGSVITINVYPRPNVTLVSSSPRTVCEEDSICFQMQVTNADFNGSPVDWIVYVGNDPHNTIAGTGGIYKGKGNQNIKFCTSTGILTDSFMITIDSIKIVDVAAALVGDSCKGTVGPQDSVIVQVLPKPFAALGEYSAIFKVTNAVPAGGIYIGEYREDFWDGASKDNNAGATYFNFTPTHNMRLDSISVQIRKPQIGTEPVNIWYRPTSYVGNMYSSAGWTLANTVTLGSDSIPDATITTLPTGGVDLTGGTTYGFYVELDKDSNIVTGKRQSLISHVWGIAAPYVGPFTTVISGHVGVRDFITPTAWTAVTLDASAKGLQLTYRGGLVVSGDTVRVCQGDSIDFDFVVGNVTYNGIPLNWQLTFTDPTNTTTYTSPVTGTGDSAMFDRIYTAGLVPGRYTFALTSVKLLPTTGAPIPPDCIHVIDDEFFTIEVVPKINAQFNKDTFNLCLGSGDVFDIEITNARFDGQPVNWQLFYTDPNSILPPSASTGAGNSTPSYTVPDSLPVGTYYLYLDSIKTVGTDPICLGTTGPLDTIVINVLPYPRAKLEATWLGGTGVTVMNDTLRICESDSVQLKITVDSAMWKGIGLGWTLNMTDGTGTLASTQTGYGDSIILDTTSTALAPGRYVIDLVEIHLDTLGLKCQNIITDNRIVLEIYSRPHAQFSVDTLNVCQDDTNTFDLLITGALFEGAPFGWTLFYTDTSGIVLVNPGDSITGSGNLSPTYGISTQMPVGQYQIVLDSIHKDNDPYCGGMLDNPDTLILNVYPKPFVSLTPSEDTVCEGITTTFTISVSNTFFHGTDSVNWRLDFSDGTMSTLGVSPLTGYGDTTVTFTTDANLSVGTHKLILTSITNTDDTCTRFLNDTFTLTVNFLPQLTILDVMDPICDGDSLRVSFRVDSMNAGDNFSFTYTVIPENSSVLPGVVSGTANGSGSYVGMFTVADTIGYPPYSRLLDFGPVTNWTTGCVEIDSVPDSIFYVHPLPSVTLSNAPTVCSGHFDPSTGTPVTGWETHAPFSATVDGTTVGSLNKSWTFYYHVEDTVSGYMSTTHSMSGVGDNGGAPYTLNVPDSLFYYFDASGAARGFKLVVDSIKITAGLALCQDLTKQDEIVFTVNPNPYFVWEVPDSICLGTQLEWDIIATGMKVADQWRVKFSWDTTANDPTPYFGPRDFDRTGSDTFHVAFPNSGYPIYATMWYLWSDTLVNKTTGCFYKPEKLDSFRVDPPTVADSLFGNTTVCEDDNAGYLYMEGYVGRILYWEASYDEGFTWDTVRTVGNFPEMKPVTFSADLDTMWYTDKTFKTRYRVWVKSGACDKDVSNVAHVYVNPRPNAAILDMDDFICSGDKTKLRVSVTSVPTSNTWTVYYTTTSPAGNGTITGTGSGIFTHYINGLNGTPSYVTLDSIYNTTTTCHNTVLTDNLDSVFVYPFTSAGVLASPDTVCKDINNGTLTLTGYTGAVVKWQYRPLGGSWTDIGNIGDTYNYVNLGISTTYRVIVKNGTCTADTSNTVTITVQNLPHASITGSDTICPGTTLDLTVRVDSTFGGAWAIQYLEGSVTDTLYGTGDGNHTLTTGNIFSTSDVTLQRIWLTAPAMNYAACSNSQIDNPGTATVTIVDQATASINNGPDSICGGSSATMNIVVSNIKASDTVKVDWSINGTPQTALVYKGPGNHSFTIPASSLPATGAPSVNYTITLDTVTNLSSTQVCAGLVDASHVIRVDTATVAGTTAGEVTVCLGANSGTVTLSNNIGDVLYWESSTDATSWTQVNNTTTVLTYNNLTDTTYYRAVVKNGACGMEYSTATVVRVKELGATIAGGDTICSGLTDDLTITIINADAATWYIALLEGSRVDTISGTGSTYTYTTGALKSSTDVVLQSIWTGTKSTPDCYKTLNNVATSTVTVLERPYATIASAPSRLCTGSSFNFTVTVSSVPTGDSWTLSYEQDGTSGTISGTGSGTFTVPSLKAVSAPSDMITLTGISAVNGSKTCDSTLSESRTIDVDSLTVGGTTSGDAVVCRGMNSGTVTLSGHRGSVIYWEASEDGSNWTQVNNTTTSLSYLNLNDTTYYRAVVKNGECGMEYSTITKISVKEISATISGGDTICSGLTDDLTINIFNTDAATWYIALLEGTRTDTISGTGSTYTYTTGALKSTSDIVLQSIWTGTKNSADCYSSLNNVASATVTVLSRPFATIASAPSRLCTGSTFNFTVSVSSVPTGDSWTLTYEQDGTSGTLSGKGSGTFTAPSLKAVTAPSDMIKLTFITAANGSKSCDSTLSETWTINVDSLTVGGTTSGSDLVCNGINTGTITLSGHRGDVIYWESSTNNTTWTQINNYTTTLTYNNLTDTTYFRAVVKNGECGIEYSTATVINVKEDPLATITGGDTICSGLTDDLTIRIENTYGDTWFIALLEGTRKDTISGTGSTYTYTTGALKSTTDIVLQDIWTGTKNSPDCYNTLNNVATATVTVIQRPFATIASGPSRLCENSNFTFTVTVSSVPTGDSWLLTYEQDGTSGTLSGKGSGTFTAPSLKGVTPTSDVITLKSISATNGSATCDSTLSSSWTISVDPLTVAGTIGDNDTVCRGGSGAAAQIAAGTGLIVKWQSKIGKNGTWIDINNTNLSNPYYNVRDTTYLRAVYQSGVCGTENSNMVVVVPKPIPFATIRTTTTDDSICAGNTAKFEIVVTNVEPGQKFNVTYLEGTTLKSTPTLTQNASGVHTLTTGVLNTSTDIELRSISAILTAGGLNCGQNLSGAITIEVLPNPIASIANASVRLCQGDGVGVVFDISNVPTGDTWSLTYSHDGNDSTITGSGSGSVTITTSRGATSPSDVITLKSITNTSTGDMCMTALTGSRTVTVDTTTVPGVIGSDITVCYGGSGSISETKPGVGVIIGWEYRVKGNSSWVSLGNSSTTINFNTLTDTTEYRAVYRNGVCKMEVSNVVTATPKPLPTATIATQAPTDTVCAGNKAVLSVTINNIDAGDSAVVTYVEGSVSKTAGFRLTMTPQTFDLETGVLSSTTDIELQTIKNVDPAAGQPTCGNTLNNVAKATVTVIDLPMASIVSGPDTLCQGDQITFTIEVSNVKAGENWRLLYTLEGDIDTLFGVGPTTVTHTDTDPNTAQSAIISLTEIVNLSNIGICKSTNMDDWNIYIFKPTVAGMIEAPDTICKGGSAKLNEVSGTTKEGRIIEWEVKPSSSGAWTTIPNNSTTLDINNLLETTSYRAIYKNGVCDTMRSNVVTIIVRELPLATLSGSTTICAGDSTDLTITVSNVGANQVWVVEYLEGTNNKSVSDTGSGNFTLRVGNFITNTDVTLTEIRTVTGTPMCVNDKLTNNATATVNINQRPYASLSHLSSPICETENVTFDITVGNVRSGESWTVTYDVANIRSNQTYSGSGPGTFTVNIGSITAVNPVQDSYTVKLTKIVNTTTGCDSSLSASDVLLVDAKSLPGTMLNGATVCYGDNSGTVNYFGGNGDVVRWESSTDGGATWSGIANTDTFFNYSNLMDTTWYRVVMQNGTCAEAGAAPIAINVRPLPVAVISGSDTICAGNTASLSVTATNTYGEDWSVSYLAGTVIDTLRVSGPLTSGTLVTNTLTSNTDVTLKKIWMTSGAPQCSNNNLGNNATATVEVNELPTATIISLQDSVCTGSPATGKASIDNVRSTENWTMYWSVNGGLADSVSGRGAGAFTFTTRALTVDPSVIRLVGMLNKSTGCFFLPTDQDTVRVSPLTNGGTLTGVDTVCYNSNSGTLTLGADAIGDVVRWEYSTDAGATWTTINHTGVQYNYSNLTKTTVFRVLVQSGVCSEEYSTTVQVVVRPLPMAEIVKVGANSVCEGSSTYVVFRVTNVMASQAWTMKYLEGSTTKNISGTGSVTDTIFTGNLTSTTDITLQTIAISAGDPTCVNNALYNNQTTTINVVPDPNASIIDYPTDVCVGTNPAITVMVDDVKSSEGWILIYRVNNGSNRTTSGIGPGKFSFNIGTLNTLGNNGVRLVSITNTSSTPNCTATLTDSVTINVDALSLGGTISGPDTVCYNSGGSVTVSGFRGTIIKWQYSTDGINYYDIANTAATNNFSNLTRRTWFRVEVKNGSCDAVTSTAKMVDVQALPTVTITNPTQSICSGSSTSLTVNVANVPTNATWTLTYTDNGTSRTFNGTGTTGTINVGPYTSTARIVITNISVTNGLKCSNTEDETATITVIPNPTATIDSAPDSLCQGDLVSFKVAVDNVATGVNWRLDYTIDGVAGATVTGTGSGVFTVNSLRAATTATDVIALTSISIVPAPACATVLTSQHTIQVSPTTVPGTLSATNSTICYGGNTTLNLTGQTGTVKRWEYSTDGGTTWTVTANSGTTLNVTNLMVTTTYRVYVQSGPCAGAYSNTVTIRVIPQPNATVSSNDRVCPGEAATFTLHVTNVGATDGWSVTYRRNGVLVATPVTGTGPGTFNFTVTGSNYLGNPTLITVDLVSITNTTFNCTNSPLASTASARVTPNPVVGFFRQNNCEDSVVHFKNLSTIAEGSITTYKWYFGDGDSSSNPDPSHVYTTAGTYTVTLVAWSDNGCRAQLSSTITINPNPVANFTFSNVCQNEVFRATDASTVASGNIASWFWTFGDGSTSTAQNPTHRYSASGTYNVSLTVTTNSGCTNTVTKQVTIYILPEANFVAEPVCEDASMNFINTSAIGYGTMTYDWNFAGQGTSTAKDPSFAFTGFGQFNVRLIAISNNGCRDTINRNVTVHPNPTAAFTVDPVCIGETSEFTNGSTVPTGSIVEYFWDFADASFSGLENPTHTYGAPGTYRVNLRVKTDKGCTDDVTADAIVIALPDVQLVPNDSQHIGGCDSVQLSARADARTWDWLRNSDTIATGVPSIFASRTGMYKVTVSVSTLGVVCFNTDSVYVKVEPLPVVNAWPRDKFNQNIDTISKGQSIELNASGTGYQINESSFVWDPTGDGFLTGGNVGTKVTTSSLLDDDQIFTVTLTDGFGCTATATVTVIVLDDFKLFPYNLISPNGDGINDTWVVENIWAYPDAKVVIFNRYGMEVFNGTNYDLNRWDGTFDGKELPDGAYYYVITHPDHPDTVYKGAINLIRNR
ncbi:MAG: PKD domain-containing protein [Flavobacteriales bacterium]|nr:PKD domain-containing protein [Flavobacteriales bacterium]